MLRSLTTTCVSGSACRACHSANAHSLRSRSFASCPGSIERWRGTCTGTQAHTQTKYLYFDTPFHNVMLSRQAMELLAFQGPPAECVCRDRYFNVASLIVPLLLKFIRLSLLTLPHPQRSRGLPAAPTCVAGSPLCPTHRPRPGQQERRCATTCC